MPFNSQPCQRGLTVLEVLVVVALAAIAAGIGVTYAMPWLAHENVRGALYDLQSLARAAHVEAASRNRNCRLLLDTATRQVLVVDGMGTPATADDVILHRTTLPPAVRFETPDASPSVTLQSLGGTWYGTTFTANGTVTAGTGSVVVASRDRHGRLSVFAAGATGVATWDGTAWSDGRH